MQDVVGRQRLRGDINESWQRNHGDKKNENSASHTFCQHRHLVVRSSFDRGWWWHGSGAFDGVSARAARSAELNAELQRLWTTDAGQPIALSLKGELVGNWTRWMNDGGETSSNVECVPVLTPWATWGNVDACTPAGFSYGGGCAGPAETPRLYRMAFFAGSDIGAGEELLYNYGKGYWSKRSDAEPVYAGRAPPAAGPSLFYDGALASEHTMQTPEDELATEEDDAGVEDAAQLVVSSPGWSPR